MWYRRTPSEDWKRVPEKWVARYINLTILGDRERAANALAQGVAEDMKLPETYFLYGENVSLKVKNVPYNEKRRLQQYLNRYGILVK